MGNQLTNDLFVYGVGGAVLRFLNFLFGLYFLRIFCLEEFGVLGLLGTISAFIAIFLNVGMNNAVQRFYFDKTEVLEEQRVLLISTAFWVNIFWSSVTTLIFLFILFPLREIIFNRFHLPWIFIVLANIPFLIVQFSNDILRIYFKPWVYVFLSFSLSLLIFGLSIGIIAFLKFRIMGVLLGGLVGGAVTVPIAILLIKNEIRFLFDLSLAKKILMFGWPFILVGLGNWFVMSFNQWIIALFYSNKEVGIFNIANSFANIINFFVTSFSVAWAPYILKTYYDKIDYKRVIKKAFSWWMFFLVLLASLLCLFLQELYMFMTPKYCWQALMPTIFLIINNVFLGTTQFTALNISFAKKTHLLSFAIWASGLVNVLFNLLLVPFFGLMGSVLSLCLSSIVLTLCYYIFSLKLADVDFNFKHIFSLLLILFITSFLSISLQSFDILVRIPIKFNMVAIIFFSGFMFKIIDFNEFKLFLKRKAI